MRYTILLLALAVLAACTGVPEQEMPPTNPSDIAQAPQWLAGPGECNPDARPEMCTLEYMPVCGDDGETYGNACGACGQENVMTFEQGACTEEENMAPTPSEEFDVQCDPDNRPQACTREYNPVCGSDGVTYGNACEACSQETVVGHNMGACEVQATETACDPDNRPQACTRQYDPVCGDDGETYSNSCQACASETVLDYTAGACARSIEEPVFCTQDAMQCPDGSYVGRQGPDCEFAPCP